MIDEKFLENETNWQRLNETFALALELDEPARREFLSRLEDDGLRGEVEAMLAARRLAESKGFLRADLFGLGARILTGEDDDPYIGRQIGKYKIRSRIGRGGMGSVYLAEREDLQQQVALKIINRGMDTDDIIRRFRLERQVLASLNHSNIARLLDGGTTADGLPFFVMEYIDGRPLTDFCDQRKLNIEERLRLFRRVCAAVDYAHQNLIVHRDIKPSNILVDQNGEPKLLDFGISKLLAADEDENTETAAEFRLMTPEYASPEQIRGERVTTASDIYSLGVLLYELLSGHRPFRLKNRAASEILQIISEREPAAPSTAALKTEEILSEKDTKKLLSPETVADSRRERPERLRQRLRGNLDNITLKALRKEPADRYQTAEQFSEDIRRHLAGLPVTARPPDFSDSAVKFIRRNQMVLSFAVMFLLLFVAAGASWSYFFRGSRSENNSPQTNSTQNPPRGIAVLPLKNLSTVTDDEYLSVGLTDALITKLGQVDRLAVRPLSAVTVFGADQIPPREAGEKLKVEWVLEGAIRHGDGRFQVSVQLVRVSDGQILWSGDFNEETKDLSKFQDAFAASIAAQLSVNLTDEDHERLARLRTTDTEAFRFYLRGRHAWNKRTADGLRESIDYFRRAIDRDPTYALAYAGLADAYALSSEYNVAPPAETFPRAKAATKKALEIEPELAEAHTTLAYILANYDWNFAEAEREYKRAIELNPNYATAHQWYAELLAALMRFDEAMVEIKRAQELDLLSPIIQTVAGLISYQSRDYKTAVAQFQKTISETPDFSYAHSYFALTYDQMERFDEAAAEELEFLRLTGTAEKDATALREVYQKRGWKAFLRALLANRNAETQKNYLHSFTQAFLYTRLEDREKALEWLEKSYEERIRYVIYIQADPNFDFLRGDPRFKGLVQRIKLPN